jgi:hypothetical protein
MTTENNILSVSCNGFAPCPFANKVALFEKKVKCRCFRIGKAGSLFTAKRPELGDDSCFLKYNL